MIKDITIGQYYPTPSIIHALDPRVKIIGTFVYIISLFCFKQMAGYLIAALFFLFCVWLSRISFRYILKGLKPIMFLLVFTCLLNLFLTPGKVLWGWKFFNITKEGLDLAAFMTLRLFFLVLGSSLLTLATTPNDLTDALERLLRPLNKIHIPVHEVAMMMSIALRFIPILVEETNKIMKAQMARGADFETGNIFVRLKNMIPLLIPLFVSAARRANDLAYAMDARCYHGGDGRTKMKPLQYAKRDFVAYIILAAYIGMLVGFVMLLNYLL